MAQTASDSRYQIRALRGYIRIARQLNLPTQQRLEMCQRALDVAQRDEEKKLVLEVLARNPSPKSLSLAVSLVDNAGLRNDAGRVAVAIAEKIVQRNREAVAAAMQQVIRAGGDQDVINKAKTLAERAK
jgi:hypothetical protein